MNKSPRLIALETLYKIFYDSSYSNIALDTALDNMNLSGLDKSFVSSLVYGVVERKLTLDYYINKYLTSKPKPKVMAILRLGAYQLLFMDKVPSSAAINESVKLCKDIKQDYYTKLVNAVLRKIDENREDVENIDDLSIKYSIPSHLISMWQKAYGKDVVSDFLPYVNGKSSTFAIPNTLYVNADELLYELNCEDVEGEVFGDLVKIYTGFDISNSKAYKNGLFHIQDLSCYECCKALDVKENQTVLDMCASPGGKSFTIAEFMNNKGIIYSFDIHQNRVSLIKKSASLMGITSIKALQNDASIYSGNIKSADRIICDVPCSGFGIIRRKPEIRYKELDSIKELPQIQQNILTTSSKYLNKNGKMIYSTCTLNIRENEKVVEKFLNDNRDFSLISERTVFPSEDNDGFYYALIERKA